MAMQRKKWNVTMERHTQVVGSYNDSTIKLDTHH